MRNSSCVRALLLTFCNLNCVSNSEYVLGITGRCEELDCAPLALAVFSDHPKYGVPLSRLAGLQLMHALHLTHPLASTITAAALIKAAGFPGPEADLPACAMLVSASLEALKPTSPSAVAVTTEGTTTDAEAITPAISSPETLSNSQIARLLQSLLPALKLLANKTPAALYRPPPPGSPEHYIRARFSEKPKLWLSKSLARIQSQLGRPEVQALRLKEQTMWVEGAVTKFVAEGTTVEKVKTI